MGPDLARLMDEALFEARLAFDEVEVPVGAVILSPRGDILSRAHNGSISTLDPTAHAEILAIRQACRVAGNYRLIGATLIVTIEPCIMCIGAALQARIARLVYGAPDPKSGAVRSLYRLAEDRRLNHRMEVIPGVKEEECRRLIQEFFLRRRKTL